MVESAYQVLGLQRDCSNADIKKAFQQLAKATHPDLQGAGGGGDSAARFIRVLAAYQILSDPHKRAIYDSEFFSSFGSVSSPSSSSQAPPSRKAKPSRNWESSNCGFSYADAADDSEVVEWLRKYRSKVTRIVHQRPELGHTTNLYQAFLTDLAAALKNIYHGPECRGLRGIPDAFEAEERASTLVGDILQLVYGRFLFATVSVSRVQLKNFPRERQAWDDEQKLWRMVDAAAYDKLELKINGRVAAYALRRPLYAGDIREEPFIVDSISVYSDDDAGGGELLGRIQGLAAMDAGLQGVVFDREGVVTHTVLQHRTPMVRHLHWYRIGDERMHCDCRCRRAWLLPSRYWLFQPRSLTHNIGGWYIETFKPKRKIPSPSKLNPAIFILAAAYKTLDRESTKKRSLAASLKHSALRAWKLLNRRLR
ncbi:uncharacterized protein LOC112347918 [Selaginella moellendorffii]|uniref:uncharacterized protein LOC112347918 n=1 Tax=Selaginella moellendorffii TaxID=88036 RepID=UPI000D1C4649|nr:uncharacterized protein LOC112347918 [Selaginella moellendorffii]|eukprot:XP_024535404.1 uncharacterized protein LOC112347918 [Selaginella moellendorffii]